MNYVFVVVIFLFLFFLVPQSECLVPEDGPASMLPGRLPLALALGHQQQLARAATLEQLRERLETGMAAPALAPGASTMEGPERKMARLAEEQQRLLQQAFQQNLLAMASQVNPANLRLNTTSTPRGEFSGLICVGLKSECCKCNCVSKTKMFSLLCRRKAGYGSQYLLKWISQYHSVSRG